MHNSTSLTHSLLGPAEGELLQAHGNRLIIKVASERQFVCDYTAPAGFPGPPLHIHPGFDETFLILDGTLTVRVDQDVQQASSGSTVYVAGSTPHTFANNELHPVRFVLICSPGGFEKYFRALVAEDQAAIAAVCEQFGYTDLPQTAASDAR